jgi:hypothetical protein
MMKAGYGFEQYSALVRQVVWYLVETECHSSFGRTLSNDERPSADDQ